MVLHGIHLCLYLCQILIVVLDFNADYEDDVQWLRNNTSSWQDVCDKWTRTTEYRTNKFSDVDIHTYIRHFPAFKEPLGFTLFSIDFSTLFPHSKNLLFTKWPTIFPKVLKIAKLKSDSFIKSILNEYEEYLKTEDGKNGNLFISIIIICRYICRLRFVEIVLALRVLPLLLPCVGLQKRKLNSDKAYKPSKSEQLEGFLLHIKVRNWQTFLSLYRYIVKCLFIVGHI